MIEQIATWAGPTVLGEAGKPVATMVDATLNCDSRDICYLVVSDGGHLGGIGHCQEYMVWHPYASGYRDYRK